MERRRLIGEELIGQGLLTRERLHQALREQKAEQRWTPLGEMVAKLGFVDEERLVPFLASHFRVSYLSLSEIENIDPDVVALVPEEIARGATLIAVFKEGTTLTIAMADPLDIIAVDNIKMRTGYQVKRAISPRRQIKAAIERYYSRP